MHRAEAGFTLIELLIAFVIGAGSLAAIFQFLSGNLAGMSRAQNREHAVLIAQSRLAELQAVGHLTPGSLEGQVDKRFRWTGLIEPYGPALSARQGQSTALYRLLVTVVWRDGASVQQVSLETLQLSATTVQP